jgi:hypothetical protein
MIEQRLVDLRSLLVAQRKVRRAVATLASGQIKRNQPIRTLWEGVVAFIMDANHQSVNRQTSRCRKQVSCPGYVAHELSGFMPP